MESRADTDRAGSPLPIELPTELIQYGDRTSSFMASYPGFESYRPAEGVVRYARAPGAWVAGTEPWAPVEKRGELFARFSQDARAAGKRTLMTPVSEALSQELVSRGFHRIQVGAEPVFELSSYFATGKPDPVDLFRSARMLKRLGAMVREVSPQDDESVRTQLDGLVRSWLENLSTSPFGFLNQVDPWRSREHKKLFVLELGGKVQALLSAVPIFRSAGVVRGYFFADYMRAPGSKPGTMELLFIEAMRSLREQGLHEVRLGLCPLARLDHDLTLNRREAFWLRVMSKLHERLRFPLNLKTIHDFKAKFRPTRWEKLFLVSASPIGLRTALDLLAVHFPDGRLRAFISFLGIQVRARTRVPKVTLTLAAVCIGLGLFKELHPQGKAVFEAYPFLASDFRWSGWLIAPLFHNTAYHFWGDVGTLVLFGGALEIAMGTGFASLVLALGLWASNPLAWLTLKLGLEPISTTQYARFLAETDYGSSNAVYAAVGALAPLIRDPRWFLVPFSLNGLFLCLGRESWISVHHVLALGMGYALTRAAKRVKRVQE